MPATERSGTRLVGGLCLFGPVSTAAQVVNIGADPPSGGDYEADIREGTVQEEGKREDRNLNFTDSVKKKPKQTPGSDIFIVCKYLAEIRKINIDLNPVSLLPCLPSKHIKNKQE